MRHPLIPPQNFFRPIAILLLLVAVGSGCRDKDEVRAKLYQHVYMSNSSLRLEIQAEITGPQTGLHYKWFSISGECDPQESTTPLTKFKFAQDSNHDRVSLEVWRADQQVARAEVDVSLNEQQMRQRMEREAGLKIIITNVPAYDRWGGVDTRADISGVIIGQYPPGSKVALFTRVGDTWFAQPDATIAADGTWGTWTHTGMSYAAILVHTNFEDDLKSFYLPNLGPDIIARDVVEGIRKTAPQDGPTVTP
jgi:hypothetical protein